MWMPSPRRPPPGVVRPRRSPPGVAPPRIITPAGSESPAETPSRGEIPAQAPRWRPQIVVGRPWIIAADRVDAVYNIHIDILLRRGLVVVVHQSGVAAGTHDVGIVEALDTPGIAEAGFWQCAFGSARGGAVAPVICVHIHCQRFGTTVGICVGSSKSGGLFARGLCGTGGRQGLFGFGTGFCRLRRRVVKVVVVIVLRTHTGNSHRSECDCHCIQSGDSFHEEYIVLFIFSVKQAFNIRHNG